MPRQSISSHASVFEDSEENLAKESVAPNKLWSFYPTSSQGPSNRHHSPSKDTV